MVRRRNSCVIDRKTYSRYSERIGSPQTQFTKSCVVAISVAMIPENPTDAVLDRITVPFGSRRAAEFARPSALIFSLVSATYSLRPSRSCQTSARPNQGIVQSTQYSGCWRLGVCPERRRATCFVRFTSQWLGISPSHSTPESLYAG